MSNPDSFIDEVTEAVRRDKLFAAFKKYGWIGIVAVVLIVGGAAWNEYSKSKAQARAEAFGDAIQDAMDLGAPEDRAKALAALPADGAQVAIKQLLVATDAASSDKAAALAALDALGQDQTQPQLYRDLAQLRRVMLAGADMPLADRQAALQGLATAGRPFRTLAQEQLAYLLIEAGKPADAITALSALVIDQESPAGLRARASQMITALGGTPPEPAAPAAEPAAAQSGDAQSG